MKLLNMNNRIKYIFGFMTVSIIGLILTQFFWLYKDYKYYSSQPLFSTQYKFFMPAVTTVSPLISADSINSIIAYPAKFMPVSKVTRTNAPGIAATTAPDTSLILKSLPGIPDNLSPVELTNDLTVAAVPAKLARRTDLTSRVSPRLYSAIPYKAPASYVINKMKWQVGGSILLITIISGCLIYMLITIYTQRKISLMKNDFINNMTHELKTPLATVAVAVEAMRNYGALEDTGKTELYLNISKNEIDHLSKLIELVLQQSVFDTDKMHIERKPTNINQLLEQLIESYQLSYNDVEFIFECDPDTPGLYLDPIHLLNAVRNLIDNAIKYTIDIKKIILTSTYKKEVWTLQVTDHGIGIPKIYHKDIFERFFRVPGKQTNTIKGFGLGLSYVKQVVELHKGTVTVKSNEQGSTFTITIKD